MPKGMKSKQNAMTNNGRNGTGPMGNAVPRRAPPAPDTKLNSPMGFQPPVRKGGA